MRQDKTTLILKASRGRVSIASKNTWKMEQLV
jgi:hypothetical protein